MQIIIFIIEGIHVYECESIENELNHTTKLWFGPLSGMNVCNRQASLNYENDTEV